ncbi:hypothetical protein [Brevibacillus sp. SIMBA_040]|uniref:hypothetical protein n=1 Tax=unclassified Brevibacillus TaxID=2684853 RepID=UPI00397B0B82
MEKKRKCVRYASFPDTTNGCIGFYQFKETGEAIIPRISVVKEKERGRSFVQVNTPEKMNEIAKQVGAKTREQFQDELAGRPWLDSYSEYLSGKIGEYLERYEERGIGLLVHVNDGKNIDEWLELWCPPGEFVRWENKRYRK